MTTTTILITGAGGFIGGKCVEFFKRKYKVITLDFRNTDYEFDISISKNFEMIQEHIDIIIHCAAQSGGYRGLVDPELDCDWNCKGTLNIVNFAKQREVKKIIYTSSMAVYGNGSYITEIAPLNPISNYGVSKLCGEYYVRTLSTTCDIAFTILRLFNTYGFGQDMHNLKQGMVSIYLAQALTDNKILVTGSFDRVRDFIHVDDVVRAVELAVLDNRTKNQIYNVCSNREITVGTLLKCITGLFDKTIELVEMDGYVGDQLGNSGNNNKLKQLGWVPLIKLEDGLKDFYNRHCE